MMNERIAQMARDAGVISAFNAAPNRPDIEKFAELLIRECVLHLHRRGVEGFGILEERNLKEHFGVEL